ncbi:uncharacterized protein LOC123683823 [Harmonia axyridis]|uniref:uncharacterized protein LOC123683823 n=1 Tax=Harmonia axyridis TaxID=115357 RepID=UPI001E277221|nr:uncharacterized protein LOC123683823 [Harmonia axyridis]
MYFLKLLIILIGLIYIEAFDIKIKYCRFRCSSSCQTPEDKSNPNGNAKPPGAYYWRDFYGVIPPDAYPIGAPSQFPQTYVGMAFDPSHNGTFATTIFEGLNYVYATVDGNVTKIDKRIQILCTMSPGQMAWQKVTAENYKSLSDYKFVTAFFHVEFVNSKLIQQSHFIVKSKSNTCNVAYAGNVRSLSAKLEYALIDGSYKSADEFLFLMYNTKQSVAEDPDANSKQSPSKSFITHYSDYQIRPNSIIPQFYKQLTIGSCSITCTNENDGNNKKMANNEKLSTSMAYYWKPKTVSTEEDAVVIGEAFNKPNYLGQAYLSVNNFDVGIVRMSSIEVWLLTWQLIQNEYQVFSTNYPEKLQWVNTTTTDFGTIDRKKIIPGGALANGTETFVCRTNDNGRIFGGSAKVFSEGTYCFSHFGAFDIFEVLTVAM